MPPVMNADVWEIVADELRGDIPALAAGAGTCVAMRSSMRRELFREVYLKKTSLNLFLGVLEDPATESSVRWLHVPSIDMIRALFDGLNRNGRDGALASLQELRISVGSGYYFGPYYRVCQMLSGRFSALVTLEIVHTRFQPEQSLQHLLDCFPHLDTFRWHDSGLSRDVWPNLAISLPPLRSFYWSESVHFVNDRFFISLADTWTRATASDRLECVGISAIMAPHFWPALHASQARLRHLCITAISDPHHLDVKLPSNDPRSNTLLDRLETLVIGLNAWSQVYDSSALVRLLDSIPSPRLFRVTFVVRHLCNDDRIIRLNWEPIIAALQRLHELSPNTRKVIRVLIGGPVRQARDVLNTEAHLRVLRQIADVQVHRITFCEKKYPDNLVPHFPLVTSPHRVKRLPDWFEI